MLKSFCTIKKHKGHSTTALSKTRQAMRQCCSIPAGFWLKWIRFCVSVGEEIIIIVHHYVWHWANKRSTRVWFWWRPWLKYNCFFWNQSTHQVCVRTGVLMHLAWKHPCFWMQYNYLVDLRETFSVLLHNDHRAAVDSVHWISEQQALIIKREQTYDYSHFDNGRIPSTVFIVSPPKQEWKYCTDLL